MRITIGTFSISQGTHAMASKPSVVWLENAEGEGMEIEEGVLVANLEEFFNKHF